MTASTTTPATEPCGYDCVYLDDSCRCYHSERVPAEFGEASLNDLVPPF
jgi:hypothetical protein